MWVFWVWRLCLFLLRHECLRSFLTEETRDDIGIFPQYAEKDVLCVNEHASVHRYQFASVEDGSPCSLHVAFKHDNIENFIAKFALAWHPYCIYERPRGGDE